MLLRLLALASLLLLGSGALRVGHAAIVHDCADTSCPVDQPPAGPDSPDGHDCPVCHVLALAGAPPVAAPAVVVVTAPPVAAPEAERTAAALDGHAPRNTRGPPHRRA
jgi:hypothetical protein